MFVSLGTLFCPEMRRMYPLLVASLHTGFNDTAAVLLPQHFLDVWHGCWRTHIGLVGLSLPTISTAVPAHLVPNLLAVSLGILALVSDVLVAARFPLPPLLPFLLLGDHVVFSVLLTPE